MSGGQYSPVNNVRGDIIHSDNGNWSRLQLEYGHTRALEYVYECFIQHGSFIEEIESILEYYTQRNARAIAIYGDQPRLQLAYGDT